MSEGAAGAVTPPPADPGLSHLERITATIERFAFVLLLIGIVVSVLVLIFTHQGITRENEFLFRFSFAVAAALIAFTMGGTVGLKWDFKGVSIRAGGAIAAFFIFFMFAPNFLTAVGVPRIDMAGVAGVDFRSAVDPGEADWEKSDVALTLEEVSFVSAVPTDLPAHLTSETVSVDPPKSETRFHPTWIVDIQPNNVDHGWLGIMKNWQPGQIDANGILSRSVMFVPDPRGSLSWQDFLAAIESGGDADTLNISYTAEVSGHSLVWNCQLGLLALKKQLALARESRNGLMPRYFEPSCERADPVL